MNECIPLAFMLELLQHCVVATLQVANRGISSLLTPIERINPSSSHQYPQHFTIWTMEQLALEKRGVGSCMAKNPTRLTGSRHYMQ